MSGARARHHKNAARHELTKRHAKRLRGDKTIRGKKPGGRAIAIAAGSKSGVEGQSAKALATYAEPASDAIEIMEIEVVRGPEDPLEVGEAEFSLVPEFYENED